MPQALRKAKAKFHEALGAIAEQATLPQQNAYDRHEQALARKLGIEREMAELRIWYADASRSYHGTKAA